MLNAERAASRMMSDGAVSTRVRPFLKWAGGKRQLLPVLSEHYPAKFTGYVEPFLGSGAVFFDLYSKGLLRGKAVRLSDAHPDLIGCYRVLRSSVDAVIRKLEALQREHRLEGDACYYDVRDCRFNPARAAAMRRGTLHPDAYTPSLAAMLIYLNHTGFNGLFRLNKRGMFNVPAGRYADPRIFDAEGLRAVARALSDPLVTLEFQSFETSLADAGRADFVYCDPPYEPLTRTSNFSRYTADGFTMLDQHRLLQAVTRAAERGSAVVMSNSSAPAILEIYAAERVKKAGLTVRLVPARRTINSKVSGRGVVDEVILSNVPCAVPGKTHPIRRTPPAERKNSMPTRR
jgi:DNA adenine methylase